MPSVALCVRFAQRICIGAPDFRISWALSTAADDISLSSQNYLSCNVVYVASTHNISPLYVNPIRVANTPDFPCPVRCCMYVAALASTCQRGISENSLHLVAS